MENEQIQFIQEAEKRLDEIVDAIIKTTKAIEAVKNYPYEITHDGLLAAGAACLKNPTKNNIKILALAVYGWMPTALDCVVYDQGKIVKAIKYLGGNQPIDSEPAASHFKVLAGLLNNSYIGVSKFLYALWPERFAIFDSNVTHAMNTACSKIRVGQGRKRQVFTNGANCLERLIVYELAMRKAFEKTKAPMRETELKLYALGSASSG